MRIALDLGTSATKAVGPAGEVSFPSVTGEAAQLFDGLRPRRGTTVSIDGKAWFVGELAAQSDFSFHSLAESKPARAGAGVLAAAALALAGAEGPVDVLCGLPAARHAQDREAMVQLVTGRRILEVGTNGVRRRREWSVDRVKVVPEALGSAAEWLLDDAGEIRPDRREFAGGRVGVIDVGGRTAGYMVLDAWQVDRAHTASTDSGTHLALRAMARAGLEEPLEVIDQRVREGRYRAEAATAFSGLAGRIQGEAETYLPRDLDVVLVTGGGGPAVYGELRLPWKSVLLDSMANVRGFMKLARRAWPT